MIREEMYSRELESLRNMSEEIAVTHNKVSDNILFIETLFEKDNLRINTIGRITDNIEEKTGESPSKLIDDIINETETTEETVIKRNVRINTQHF